ncbi:shikimate kinase [Carbonactinospora thermoautotrophica]|uniref:Shikimate kinase n=3 Tax=Carbonactinospora thermoautotrophica TaxID=1469144 RepID=A0A132N5A6_9ACTN|nr:shikimate kinase [Carbonactinospora thermoautotrophica]KWX05315.1 shikimate kinase [Carbonactinospora thermoautotrophica]
MTGPRVVLVGPPGAGKSTVGQVLAARLGVAYRDTDADIEQAAGMPIRDIFVEHGEPYFRRLEREAVAAAVAEHPGVLAVGGGAIMDEGSRALLRGRKVAFLDVGLAEAARRVGLNRDRPLLLGNVRAQLKQLMDARRPWYEEVATVTVLTDGRTPEEVADEVIKTLELDRS